MPYDATVANDPNHEDYPRNRVRLLAGDTVPGRELLSDEEIEGFISTRPTLYAAAAAAARAIAARFAREADKWIGDLKILNSQKHRNYLKIAEELDRRGALLLAVPSAGGIRHSDKETLAGDSDIVQPFFYRGMHDFEDQ